MNSDCFGGAEAGSSAVLPSLCSLSSSSLVSGVVLLVELDIVYGVEIPRMLQYSILPRKYQACSLSC